MVLAVLENPAVRAVRVALAVLENPVDPAVQVVLAVPENQVVPAARAAVENPAVPVALVRQVVAALLSQVEVVAKAVQIKSVDITRLQAAAVVAPSLAAVAALLKPRAAGVEVA